MGNGVYRFRLISRSRKCKQVRLEIEISGHEETDDQLEVSVNEWADKMTRGSLDSYLVLLSPKRIRSTAKISSENKGGNFEFFCPYSNGQEQIETQLASDNSCMLILCGVSCMQEAHVRRPTPSHIQYVFTVKYIHRRRSQQASDHSRQDVPTHQRRRQLQTIGRYEDS